MKNIAVFLLLVGASMSAQDIGPAKGTLVIVGGNMQDPAIVKRFIDLAGGPDAAIVIIPTAGEAETVIYSNTPVAGASGRFYSMGAGDRFDMKARKATRRATEWRPLQGVRQPQK